MYLYNVKYKNSFLDKYEFYYFIARDKEHAEELFYLLDIDGLEFIHAIKELPVYVWTEEMVKDFKNKSV